MASPINGTQFDDTLVGTAGHDVIKGFGGNDRLVGANGSDWLSGGAGDDDLDGGNDTSIDVLKGGSGNDRFGDSGGDDFFDGGSGIDTARLDFLNEASGIRFTLRDGPVVTSFGTKTLSSIEAVDILGSQHGDTITGGRFTDGISGRGGDDYLFGGKGRDFLNGGDDNDWLFGGSGDDELLGESGKNVLSGGRGDDRLFSAADSANGDDVLIGGQGKDTFYVNLETGGQGHDLVLDFKRGQDRIGIESLGEGEEDDPGSLDAFEDLDTNGDGRLDRRDETVTVSKGNLTIDFTSFEPFAGGTLTIKGYKTLFESDFFIA